MKYKKGDVIAYNDSKFFILGTNTNSNLYKVEIFDELRFELDFPVYKRGERTLLNKYFVERHCKKLEGATARTIRILYGPKDD